MKDTFKTFALIDYQNIENKDLFKNAVKELFNSMNKEITIEVDSLATIIINNDIDEDIVESLKSLVQDFDNNVFIFEGFRIRNTEEIKLIKDVFINNHFKNYMKVSDLILKANDIELNVIKKVLLPKIEKDNYLNQIINSMFDNNLNVTKTASCVYMHRNSINNKLNYLEKETGINMQVFNEAVAMYTLIKK